MTEELPKTHIPKTIHDLLLHSIASSFEHVYAIPSNIFFHICKTLIEIFFDCIQHRFLCHFPPSDFCKCIQFFTLNLKNRLQIQYSSIAAAAGVILLLFQILQRINCDINTCLQLLFSRIFLSLPRTSFIAQIHCIIYRLFLCNRDSLVVHNINFPLYSSQ